MKKLILPIIALIAFTGCSTTLESIEKEYALIDFYDGISESDAILIAQDNVMNSRFKQHFDVFFPRLETSEMTNEYPNVWFVSFPLANSSEPLRHLLLIDKRTGGVVRATDWKVESHRDFSWVFDF